MGEAELDKVYIRRSCLFAAAQPHDYPALPSPICDSSYDASISKHSQSSQTVKCAHMSTSIPTLSWRDSPCFITKVSVKSSQKDFSCMKMSSFVFLLSCTLIPHMCAASALLPARTTVSDQIQPQLPSLTAQGLPVCVKAVKNPDWAGTINANDCADAIGRLWDRVSPYGYTLWTFWASSVD